MSTWDNTERLANAPSITYDEAGVLYDDIDYNYNGQVKETWTTPTKN